MYYPDGDVEFYDADGNSIAGSAAIYEIHDNPLTEELTIPSIASPPSPSLPAYSITPPSYASIDPFPKTPPSPLSPSPPSPHSEVSDPPEYASIDPYPRASSSSSPPLPPSATPPSPLSHMTPGTGAIQRESWAKQEHQYIKRYFERDTRNFKYEGILGYGATNVACKVKLRHRWWRYSLPSETFVVKRAFVPDQDAILKNEHRIIKRHRGALHIVQPYELPRTIANPLDRAERYTILLEHLENGSLSDFISRKQLWGHELPNRMLFKMFMCLVRACMAMAWPPRAPRGRRVMREGIPDDPEERQNKEQLTHRDMHTGNILLGELDIAHWEHITTPILKLIDFERAVIVEDPAVANPGVSRNILGIGKVMREIVTGNRYAYIRETTIRVNGFPEEIRSFAHLPEDRYPNLDDELRTLIVQCCAADLDQRPTLEELYVRVRECIVARPSRVYPRYPLGQYETDRAIRRIARRLIFDAPV